MGNYRFKLSEIIPNAWFYKLRDMGKSRKLRQNTAASPSPKKKQHAVPTSPTKTAPSPRPHHSRRSYYYSTRHRHRHRHRSTAAEARSSPKRLTSAVSSACSCRAKSWSGIPDSSTTSGDSSLTAGSFSPELRSDHVLLPDDNTGSSPSPCSAKFCNSPEPDLELPPIITKPAKKPSTEPRKLPGRKTTSPRVRLRLSSPRVSVTGGRRSGSVARRSTAVVKASVDPRRDFKESMVEMIVENNIRASKDLEDLLASYLCLNSDEYHDIIINVFKQIWLEINSLNLPHFK